MGGFGWTSLTPHHQLDLPKDQKPDCSSEQSGLTVARGTASLTGPAIASNQSAIAATASLCEG